MLLEAGLAAGAGAGADIGAGVAAANDADEARAPPAPAGT
jgi:hypothetical protein